MVVNENVRTGGLDRIDVTTTQLVELKRMRAKFLECRHTYKITYNYRENDSSCPNIDSML